MSSARYEMAGPALTGTLVLALTLCPGCWVDPIYGDPNAYETLTVDNFKDTAVVRLYAGPIPMLELTASHLWFVVKSAHADRFDRWEVWVCPSEPYGYVRKNLFEPEEPLSVVGVAVLDEITGPQAQDIIDFIENESPNYPCANAYYLLGPNSNSYVTWILDNAGWHIDLPETAIGKDVPPICPSDDPAPERREV